MIGPWFATTSPILRYGVAGFAVLVTTLLRTTLNPFLGTSAPLLPLIPSVLLTTLAVGSGPGYIACILAPALMIFLLGLSGEQMSWMPWFAHSAFFAMMGAIIVTIIRELQRAQSEQSALLVEANEAERRAVVNEMQLYAVADSTPMLIAYLDRDHRYRFVNDQYRLWFDMPRVDILGKHAREVLGESAYATAIPWMNRALQGQPVVFESRMPGAGGERFVRGRYVPRRDLEGTVLGFLAVIEDITERKRVEQELVELHQHLSLALRAGRSGTFEWDIENDKNIWSDELLELYGFPHGEVVETHEGWLACVVAEDRERMAASAAQALTAGADRAEFRIRRRDTGELRWIHARSKVFYDEDGKPVRMVGANTDITEHKLAAEALADRERTLQLIYDNSSDGIALLRVGSNDELSIVSVNATLLRAAGKGRDQVEGMPLQRIVPPLHWPFILAKCREAIMAGERVSFETDIYFPAGRVVGDVTLLPVTSAAGLHLLGCVRDVTKERALEAAQRVEHRRKDEFLAMLAHELRNPLVPIRNIGHLLTRQPMASTKSQELGRIIERQTKHLTRLVDDLLDVSRITRGDLDLHREYVSIDDVIRESMDMLTATFDLKHQRSEARWLASNNVVMGDKVRLVQVFANLLSNASKYSPEGAAIQVCVEREDRTVVVRVIDRGEGIDPLMLGKVFELFVQADRSLDRRNGGLGIGLTIAKRLVEFHGGWIEVRSDGLGKGSEFIVRLPAVDQAGQRASTMERPPVPALSPSPTGQARVLVVEDNASAATTLVMMLEVEGLEVRMVHDGRSAMQVLESYEAQVILLDIGLPDMDGFLVAQSVRERYANRRIHIIAVTGYGTTVDRELALKSGFDAHLTKPVEPAKLLRAIGEALAIGETRKSSLDRLASSSSDDSAGYDG